MRRWTSGSLWPVNPMKRALPGLLRFQHRLQGAALGEEAIGVLHADVLVELDQVDVIGLQPLERFVDLLGRRLLRAAVELGHEEDLLPIAVAKGLAHADFALALVVVPGVIQEGDAPVHAGADQPDALLLILLLPIWNPPMPISETSSPVWPSLR